jgi:hypothetical protein
MGSQHVVIRGRRQRGAKESGGLRRASGGGLAQEGKRMGLACVHAVKIQDVSPPELSPIFRRRHAKHAVRTRDNRSEGSITPEAVRGGPMLRCAGKETSGREREMIYIGIRALWGGLQTRRVA